MRRERGWTSSRGRVNGKIEKDVCMRAWACVLSLSVCGMWGGGDALGTVFIYISRHQFENCER
jgi:hypothetical protein